jgi:hypothetical protein
MPYFAKIVDRVVTKVIVADQDFINSMVDDSPGTWVQTYKDRSARAHYAGIGYTYDRERDAFIPPKPFDSWVLNEDSCLWGSPVPYPSDGAEYVWDEPTTSWQLSESGA